MNKYFKFVYPVQFFRSKPSFYFSKQMCVHLIGRVVGEMNCVQWTRFTRIYKGD